ncbi:unnamed protein product [Oncorhynchus mykiss]|uniref:Uncharacterized protein n=1 Tax=Oncorhynchus mykiss TaxID=8022 RepID=A0A060Z4F6_ONCMY|nr:unnamed protein product [Oncorhynchus mykiss]
MLYNISHVLIEALVISRLDYCNSVGWAPHIAIKLLQLIQNAAAAWCSTFLSSPMSPCSSAHSTGFLSKLRTSKGNCTSLSSDYVQALHTNLSTPFCHLWSLGPIITTGGQLSPVRGMVPPTPPTLKKHTQKHFLSHQH